MKEGGAGGGAGERQLERYRFKGERKTGVARSWRKGGKITRGEGFQTGPQGGAGPARSHAAGQTSPERDEGGNPSWGIKKTQGGRTDFTRKRCAISIQRKATTPLESASVGTIIQVGRERKVAKEKWFLAND